MEEFEDNETELDAFKKKSACFDIAAVGGTAATELIASTTTSDANDGLQPTEAEMPSSNMLYTIEDIPPWYLCILLAIQQSLTCIGSNVALSLMMASAMCVTDYTDVSYIITAVIFVQGIVTLMQSTFGTRLPIVQGATAGFLTPTLAILNLPKWRCPVGASVASTAETVVTDVANASFPMHNGEQNATAGDSVVWHLRMREIQGAVAIAALCQVFIGLSGVIGFILRFIGPLSIGPTTTLVGLSLYEPATAYASKQWFIAIGTAVLILLFSQYLRNVQVPCWFTSCKNKRKFECSRHRFPLFTLFPVMMAIIISWIFCAILTASNAFPNDPSHWSYPARTDARMHVLSDASWFRFPYPFQWGIPTVSLAAVLGMTAGVLAGIMESIGDYYACARISGAPPPPVHALNRGILIEGIGCIIAAIWGGGTGSTSYSENVGAIGVTKVGSRRVVQITAGLLLFYGIIGKLGALFVTIPDPVIGGIFLILLGMVSAIGISNLQFVDLNSTRNLCVFGVAVFMGLVVPHWVNNTGSISTGIDTIDQIITILLSTSMFVGGVIGFILDNTIPGTPEERGMLRWREHLYGGSGKPASAAVRHRSGDESYDLPWFCKPVVASPVCRYIPVCPTYTN